MTMILTKALCRLGWHDKIASTTYYFDAQGRAIRGVVTRCRDCRYYRLAETFADQETRPKP